MSRKIWQPHHPRKHARHCCQLRFRRSRPVAVIETQNIVPSKKSSRNRSAGTPIFPASSSTRSELTGQDRSPNILPRQAKGARADHADRRTLIEHSDERRGEARRAENVKHEPPEPERARVGFSPAALDRAAAPEGRGTAARQRLATTATPCYARI